MRTANLQEIFRSIQGEGKYAGIPAVFVRFSGCNLRCNYCDTKRSWRPVKYCAYQPGEPDRHTVRVPNAVSARDCADMISYLAPSGLVSFTGGEPLLQAQYIAQVIKLLGNKYTYLIETNGTLPGALKFLPARKNIVYSVDLKQNNPRFLRFYRGIPEASPKYLKIVLEKSLNIAKILKILAKTDSEIYLQPVNNRFDRELLQKWLFLLDKSGYFYRIMPQLHKIMHFK